MDKTRKDSLSEWLETRTRNRRADTRRVEETIRDKIINDRHTPGMPDHFGAVIATRKTARTDESRYGGHSDGEKPILEDWLDESQLNDLTTWAEALGLEVTYAKPDCFGVRIPSHESTDSPEPVDYPDASPEAMEVDRVER